MEEVKKESAKDLGGYMTDKDILSQFFSDNPFSEEEMRQHRVQNNFLLDENNVPYPCEDLLTWGRGIEKLVTEGRKGVKKEMVGKFFISTVFLGLNHNFIKKGLPLLFETMVFNHGTKENKYLDHYMERYSTWDEAEKGHDKIADMVRMTEG